MDNYLDLMRARREQILERFYAALDRAGRPHDAARLIAVSKTVGVDETIAAIRAGYRHFAENARKSSSASLRVWRSIRSCPRCVSI
ncbi:MAG: hypothetical protein ACLRM9_03455 [Collinsella aerofaciens]